MQIIMKKNINKIMGILSKKYNITKTTLNNMREKPDAFKILVSCLISLRTRDENTAKISEKLFNVAKTPEGIIKLPTKKLEKLIFSSGYYKNKAKTIKHVSKEILKKFNGRVPDTREELLSIKGIGPKTANIVLAFAYGKNVIPVDVNVHRIVNRLGWVETKTAEKTEIKIHKIMPKKFWSETNSILIQFGREICLPVSPWCSKCPIKKYCPRIGIKKSR